MVVMMGDESPPPPAPPPKPRWMAQHHHPAAVASVASSASACAASTASGGVATSSSAALHHASSPARSPTVTRSIQPAGTTAQQRQIDRANSTTPAHSPAQSRTRNRSGSTSSIRTTAHEQRRATAVFCDVVVDELEIDRNGKCVYPQATSAFLNSLGSPLRTTKLDDDPESSRPASRPSTPRKPAKVDIEIVRRMLAELAHTEESYYKKIKSLHEDFEKPLRKFAQVPTTAIISDRAVAGLFSNLELLVPISNMFNQDLQAMLGDLNRDRRRLPSEFGPMIRHHVRSMHPFAEYLNDHRAADAIRRALDAKVSGFRTFIERQQVTSREKTQQTGGFKEFLAEPFQRIARYQLMLERELSVTQVDIQSLTTRDNVWLPAIIRHLPEDDPNVDPLQQALDTLNVICSMPVDTSKRQPAIQWSLKTTIDSFVQARGKYLTSIDVDETYEPEMGGKPVTLRCTLFLFEQELVLAKRPSGDSKTGAQLAGLADLDEAVVQYKVQDALSHPGGYPGSPTKKMKGATMGYRGRVDVLDIEPRTVGGGPAGAKNEFALVLDPPPMDQSERWNGRGMRRYAVANSYQTDAKKASEKEAFLSKLAEAKGARWVAKGARAVRRGRGGDNEVYWVLWEKSVWDRLAGERRGKLALHLDEHDASSDELLSGVDGHPLEIAKATFLGSNQCRLTVRSTRDNASRGGEIIDIERISAVISELGTSQSMLDVPVPRPTTPGGSRRTRTGIMDAALNVFGAGSSNASSLLKGGNSTGSRTSNGSTATATGKESAAVAGPSTPRSPFESSISSRTERPRSGIFGKRSEPDLQARKRAASTSGSTSIIADYMLGAIATPALQSTALGLNSSISSRRPGYRRSSSLPPPAHARFDSTSSDMDTILSSIENEDDDDDAATLSAATITRRRSRTEPDQFSSVPPVIPPIISPTPVDSSWLRSEPTAPMSSPMEYRPSARRRMIGPRELGSAPGSGIGEPRSTASSPQISAPLSSPRPTASLDTDLELSRADSRSSAYAGTSETEPPAPTPSPTPTLTSASPIMLDNPRSPTPSTASAVPAHLAGSICPPSPLRQSVSRRDSESISPPSTKRPLGEDPSRVSPARKRPSLGDGPELQSQKLRGPRGPSPAANRPRFGAVAGTTAAGTGSTSPSGSTTPPRKVSVGQIKIRSRRVTSGASTIRGVSPQQSQRMTPPLPLSEADAQDVFVARVTPSPEQKRKVSTATVVMWDEEEAMDEGDESLEVGEKLQRHVQVMRNRLAKEAASFNKENDRILSSPGGMARSPHTRNVAIKAHTPSSSVYASSFAEGRLAGSTIDITTLLRWLEHLNKLVAKLDASNEANKVAPPSRPATPQAPQSAGGPSEAEFAMLDAERELIAAELAALKHELSMRSAEDSERTFEVERLSKENSTLRKAYEEIIGEVEVLYEQFNTRLGEVVSAMQVDPAIGVSDDTYTILSSQLREAVVARSEAEHELRMAQHKFQREMEEKAEWKRILVKHNLLPT